MPQFVSALLVIATALALPPRSIADTSTCLSWSVAATTTQRTGAASIWDPVRHRMITFGGWDGSQFLGDLIALDAASGASWMPLAASGTAPSPRDGANAVYDPVRDQLVLFRRQ
jgi:hypothetical protein